MLGIQTVVKEARWALAQGTRMKLLMVLGAFLVALGALAAWTAQGYMSEIGKLAATPAAKPATAAAPGGADPSAGPATNKLPSAATGDNPQALHGQHITVGDVVGDRNVFDNQTQSGSHTDQTITTGKIEGNDTTLQNTSTH
jgi:hypothetical protein